MRNTLLAILIITCSACSSKNTDNGNVEIVAADAIYLNGNIYTVDSERPWAKAVAIKDGKILKVGSDDEMSGLKGSNTRIIDLKNQFVMPGIIDTHIHPSLAARDRAFCALPGTFHEPSEEQILSALKECIKNYPSDRKWFIAQGYTTPAMSKETLTRKTLDELVPDRPAWIVEESGHNAWFNTKAMELAGVTNKYEDSPGGFFSRKDNGDLAGIAFEAAMEPFAKVLPAPTDESMKQGIMKLIDEANSQGITAFGDALVLENDLQAWHELNQENNINSHAVLYLKGNEGTDELTPVNKLLSYYEKYDLPGAPAVKLFMGGALESHSEAVIDGYLDKTKSPQPIIEAEKFSDYMQALDDAGIAAKVHAIGDGAVRATLDGYESVIKAKGKNHLRHHIDHCSLVHPDDFQRFVDLDVSCTIWPPLNAPIAYNTENVKPVLKSETWQRIYANRDMWDAGIKLVNHSDAWYAVLWPWWSMEAAITRGFPGKPERGALGKEQGLTLEEVIQAYTINAAWALRLDNLTGSIKVGKSADMIILSQNLFLINPTEIHNTQVMRTLFKGKEIYRHER